MGVHLRESLPVLQTSLKEMLCRAKEKSRRYQFNSVFYSVTLIHSSRQMSTSVQTLNVGKENSALTSQEPRFVTADRDSLTKRTYAEEVLDVVLDVLF